MREYAQAVLPLNVLVVDDDADHRWLMRDALRLTEYPCLLREASSGDEALETLLRDAPDPNARCDVVLLDIEMPGRDGLAVLEKMRQIPALRSVAAVVVTGIVLTDAQRETIRRHGVPLVFKTPDVIQLSQALRRALERCGRSCHEQKENSPEDSDAV